MLEIPRDPELQRIIEKQLRYQARKRHKQKIKAAAKKQGVTDKRTIRMLIERYT